MRRLRITGCIVTIHRRCFASSTNAYIALHAILLGFAFDIIVVELHRLPRRYYSQNSFLELHTASINSIKGLLMTCVLSILVACRLVERLVLNKRRDNSGILIETRHANHHNDEDKASNPITAFL